jgi:hypothetical protein
MFGFDRNYRRRNDNKSKDESSDLDAELLQRYGYKYLSWAIEIDWELVKEPAKLEDWDLEGGLSRFRQTKQILVGHYEVDTAGQLEGKIIGGFSHFDYIDLPESKVVLQLALNPDRGSENNYGLVERTVTIPAQILKFDNLRVGDWREGEVNPYSINLKIDIEKLEYTFDKEDTTGFNLGLWNGWNDLEGVDSD